MPKFPEPPPARELAKIPADIKVLPAGALLWRLYFRGGTHPVDWSTFRSFGPVKSGRFDHHAPERTGRSILYAAVHGAACVAEVFQGIRAVDWTEKDPWLAGFEVSSDLSLLDLTGFWPTRAGASMAINSGPRDRARRWSQAIYEAYPEIQGLYYPSSMYGNRPALALYERAAPAMPASPAFHRSLADPALLNVLLRVADETGYDLL